MGEWSAQPGPVSSSGCAASDPDTKLLNWLIKQVSAERAAGQEVVILAYHWGANYVRTVPPEHVTFARGIIQQGDIDIVVGTSSHHPLAVEFVDKEDSSTSHTQQKTRRRGCVFYGTGDCLDDYAVDPVFRNDFGIIPTVVFDKGTVLSVHALPIHLTFCHTDAAQSTEVDEITSRLTNACSPFGTYVLGPRADGTLEIGRGPVV